MVPQVMLSGTPKSAQEQCERAVEPESEARASGAAGKSCTEWRAGAAGASLLGVVISALRAFGGKKSVCSALRDLT